MTKEEQIKNYMKKLQISKEEAEQLFTDDMEDFIGEEGEKMTEQARKTRRYEKSNTPKKERKPKVRKVDENKACLLDILHKTLTPIVKITNIKTETELSFVYNNEEYTLKLIKHRAKK